MKRIALAVLVALTALVFSDSAHAVGNYSAPLSQPSTNSYFKVYPLNDRASVEMWTTMDGDGWQALHTAKLNLDGTLGADTVLENLPLTSYRIVGWKNWALLPDGRLAVAWSSISYVSNAWVSRTNIAFTADGEHWTAPVQVFGDVSITDEGLCEMWTCGLQWPHLAIDSKGSLGIATQEANSQSLYLFKTSRDGVNWSTASTVRLGATSNSTLWDLAAVPGGGFLAVYESANQSDYSKYDLYTTRFNSVSKTWSLPTARFEMSNYLYEPQLVQTGPSQLSLIVGEHATSQPITIKRSAYDSTTDSFPQAAETLATAPDSWLNMYNNQQFDTRGNLSAYAISITSNGARVSRNRLFIFRDGALQPVVELPNTSDQATHIIGVHINSDGSVSVAWSGDSTEPTMAKYKDGIQVSTETIPIGMSAGNPNSVMTPSGNLFLVMDYWDSGIQQQVNKSITLESATAPSASSAITFTGKAKRGSKLTAKIPTFASAVTGVGVSKVQWYACAVSIPVATNAVPQTCVAIKKATAKAFKVTAKQKKTFLTVAVSNRNSYGITTSVAKSSTKVK